MVEEVRFPFLARDDLHSLVKELVRDSNVSTRRAEIAAAQPGPAAANSLMRPTLARETENGDVASTSTSTSTCDAGVAAAIMYYVVFL